MDRLSPPRKPKNTDVRPREYLTETEVERLMGIFARTPILRHNIGEHTDLGATSYFG